MNTFIFVHDGIWDFVEGVRGEEFVVWGGIESHLCAANPELRASIERARS